MVVVDKLSNESHFIPIKSTYKDINIVDMFMKEICRVHGVPKVVFMIGMQSLQEMFGKIYLKV